MRIVRPLTTVIAPAGMAIALLAGPAGAHAVFVGSITTFPVSTRQDLVMNVPHEREDTIWNTDVIVAMPTGWTALGCVEKATWSCTLGSEDGFQTVHFRKDGGAPPAEDETFRFTVRTAPSVGTFAFPTVQVYSDGEEVSWIGGPETPEPAPRLQTVPAGASTTTAPPTTNPHTTSPTTQGSTPATTRPPTGGPGSGSTGGAPIRPGGSSTNPLSPGANPFASSTTTPDQAATTTTSPGSTTTTTVAPDDADDDADRREAEERVADASDDSAGGDSASQVAVGGATSAPKAGSSDGGSTVPWLAAGALIVAGAAGGLVVRQRRASTTVAADQPADGSASDGEAPLA